MRFGRTILSSVVILATVMPCVALTHARRGPTSPKLFTKHAKAKPGVKPVGQRTIDDNRAAQIQASLIKSGYLPGGASGHWDAQTEAAMQKFQSDNGWQTKLVPDSRAIIKLGLGPTRDSSAIASSETSSMSSFLQ